MPEAELGATGILVPRNGRSGGLDPRHAGSAADGSVEKMKN
jgi:hypothetical protein